MSFHWGFNYKEERMKMGRKHKNLKGTVLKEKELKEK